MFRPLFRIRFDDGGLDGGSHTGYMIRTLKNNKWYGIDINYSRDDIRFDLAVDEYREVLLAYWNKHCNVTRHDGHASEALIFPQYTATINQPLWLGIKQRIIDLNREVRTNGVSETSIQSEMRIRLALLHVDPAMMNRILGGDDLRYQALCELSHDDLVNPEYQNGMIRDKKIKGWSNDYLERYGNPADCPRIEDKIKFRTSVPEDEIRKVEQETGFKFYYLIPHANRIYGLYVNPAHPELWMGERRALNSGNYEKGYSVKPVLRFFAEEDDCKVKYVMLPLCNCMGRIRIDQWNTKTDYIY